MDVRNRLEISLTQPLSYNKEPPVFVFFLIHKLKQRKVKKSGKVLG